MKIKILTASLLCSFFAFTVSAQHSIRKIPVSSVGFSAGTAHYFGDLSHSTSFMGTSPQLTALSLGAFAAHRFNRRLSVRANFSWLRLKGDDGLRGITPTAEDAGRRIRNLSFRNDVKELAITGSFDLIPNYGSYLKRNSYQPYIFMGLAAFYHNPRAYYNGGLMEEGWYNLQPLQTEGLSYSRIQISLPFGLGMRYKLNSQTDLGFELGWRKTFTDYLDDVSTVYQNKGDLNTANGNAAWILADRTIELDNTPYPKKETIGSDGNRYPVLSGFSKEGSRRGNSTDDDWYLVSSLTFTYYLEAPKSRSKFR